ncbi:MAG: glycosyltransferase family 4 protein [Planctomycetota bacterium]|jgi:glycosyltransferase involved in cell wall biosynthesis
MENILEGKRIALVRYGPPGTAGGVIMHNLKAYLQKRRGTEKSGPAAVEDVMVLRSGKDDTSSWESPPDHVVTYTGKSLRDWQVRRGMPKFDLYHFHSHVLLGTAKKLKPTLFTIDDIIPFKLSGTMTEKKLARFKKTLSLWKNTTRLAAVSEYTRRDLMEILGVPEERAGLIPNGVDLNVFTPGDRKKARKTLGLPADAPIVLNIGGERLNKNIERLFNAFALVRREFPGAVLVRAGIVEPKFTPLISELGLEGAVIRNGPVTTDPIEYFRAADVYVCQDISGGFGMPNLEAMACGCPVATSKNGAFPEVVGDAGVYFDPYEHEEIAEAIKNVLGDTALREKNIQLGLERAKKYDWELATDAAMREYRLTLEAAS